MKTAATIVLPIVYLLFFHVASEACFMIFGTYTINPDLLIQLRGIGYVSIAAFLSAAITCCAYILCFKMISQSTAFIVAGASILLLLAKTLISHGLGGLMFLLSFNPVNVAVTYVIIFSALPILAGIWRHAANSAVNSDGKRPLPQR